MDYNILKNLDEISKSYIMGLAELLAENKAKFVLGIGIAEDEEIFVMKNIHTASEQEYNLCIKKIVEVYPTNIEEYIEKWFRDNPDQQKYIKK